MSPLIRGGLFVVGFAGAVGLGYALKPTPKPVTAADSKPTVVLNVPPAPTPTSTVQVPAKIEAEPELVIPPPSGRKAVDEPLKPTDAEYKLIAKALGHKTTLDDEPVVRTGGVAPPSFPELPPVPPPPPPLPPAAPPLALAQSTEPRQAVSPPAPPALPPINTEIVPPAPMVPPSPNLRIEVGPVPSPDPTRVGPAARVAPSKIILNTRAMSFNFEVTKVGPSKVKAVELWASRDGGTNWQKYDRMLGDKPPFNTYVGGEGDFRFDLVFESESGQRTPAPTGRGRSVEVEIDTTPPRVSRLTLHGGGAGQVELKWEAEDKNLDARRTRLEFSPDGRAWRPIPLADNGPQLNVVPLPPGRQHVYLTHYSYVWKLPDGLPHELHFRVTAVDRAGNEGSATIPERLSIDLVAPEGKLTGAEPQRAAERGPMPRVVETKQIFSFWVGLLSAGQTPAQRGNHQAAVSGPDQVPFPFLEPGPDHGPNPIRHLRGWLQAVTGQDPVRPPEPRVVGVARMGSGAFPIYSDGLMECMPDAMDRLLAMCDHPFADSNAVDGYRQVTELRAFRERLESRRRIAVTLSGEPSLVSAIPETDWSPLTAKPGPPQPQITWTGSGLLYEW
jgi:hypothetical protein